jgi:OPA family sugar phosphate sensor protein UhpC-like MFS transporter
MNLIFGMDSSMSVFLVVWFINGLCQGIGWPPVAKLMTEWIPKEQRASWWSAASAAQSLGGAAIAIGGSAMAEYYGWRTAMIAPGCLAIVVSLMAFERIRSSPTHVGLPEVEPVKGTSQGPQESTRQIIYEHIFKNKYIWLISLASMLHCIINESIILEIVLETL